MNVATPTGSASAHIQRQNFSLNQQPSVLCLPVLCADHKLAWVHPCSIAQELSHADEVLRGAFGVFPYPTPKDLATLACLCSLHMDQVRVWFMVRRLCYGISWDGGQIRYVRNRLLGSGRRGPAAAGEDDRQVTKDEEEEEEEEEEEDGPRRNVDKCGSSEGSGRCAKVKVRGAGMGRAQSERSGGGSEVGGEKEEGEEEEEQELEGRVEMAESPGRPRQKRKRGQKKEEGETSKKRRIRAKAMGAHKTLSDGKLPKRFKNNAPGDRRGRARILRFASWPRVKGDLVRGRAGGGPESLTSQEPVLGSTSPPPPVLSVRHLTRRHGSKITPFDLSRVQVSERCSREQKGNGEKTAGHASDSTVRVSEDGDVVSPPNRNPGCVRSQATGRPKSSPGKTWERLETIDLKAIGRMEESGPVRDVEDRFPRVATFPEAPDDLTDATLANESFLGNDSPLASDALCGDEATLGNLALPASKAKARPPNAWTKSKSKAQTHPLRQAFRACPFPSVAEYDRLSERTGLPRRAVTRWFGDMRYSVKTNKSRWLAPGERQHIRGRIKQWQRMRALMQVESMAKRGDVSDPGPAAWRLKLEGWSQQQQPPPTPPPPGSGRGQLRSFE